MSAPLDLEGIDARAMATTLPFELHNPGWMDGVRDPRVLANLEFFAHARSDIPALVAEVKRLRAWLDALRAPHRWSACLDGVEPNPGNQSCNCGPCAALRGEQTPG